MLPPGVCSFAWLAPRFWTGFFLTGRSVRHGGGKVNRDAPIDGDRCATLARQRRFPDNGGQCGVAGRRHSVIAATPFVASPAISKLRPVSRQQPAMTGPPTFAIQSSFLGVTRQDPGAALVVAGIPLDIGTTNRAGARDGPAAIRRASRMLTDGDHPHALDRARNADLADIGDFALALGDIPASLALIEQQAAGDQPPDRAGRRAWHHPAAAARAGATARRAARAGAFRRACRYLAGQFRPGLCARLGVLPRHRRGAGRSAPHDPDRHPLARAARRVGLDDRPGRARC